MGLDVGLDVLVELREFVRTRVVFPGEVLLPSVVKVFIAFGTSSGSPNKDW